jgi:hypothetical protein
MPGKNRATPGEATLFLGSVGVTGGGICDAVLARCALKAGARTIYSWNVKHFRRLGPEIAKRVATP